MIGKIVNKALMKFDLRIVRPSLLNKEGDTKKKIIDILNDDQFQEFYTFCSPFTMTSIERMYSLYTSVKYIIDNDIEGDFVECGVWRGGSSMLIAKYLTHNNINDRRLYLYDTFEGMNEPTDKDRDYKGTTANEVFSELSLGDDISEWCKASFDEVRQNMLSTGFDEKCLNMIQGKVEETIPQVLPKNRIALLRLDTDWYESTKHELIHLYPLLVSNGILIIDDFGHWDGAKKAVLEYFQENPGILLNRIDYTGRIGIKTSPSV